jgi:hypothetical protein
MAAPTNNNTLTSLIPDAYAALDVVSRELIGFIPAVSRDPRADRVAVGQSLRSPVAPVNSAGGDIVPAMSVPSAANQTIGNKAFTLTKSRYFPFSWSGEDIKSVDQGPGFLTIQQDQIAQAFRAAANEIETDIAVAAALGASRGFGATAGTAPLFTDWAQAKKILDDNGAPASGRSSVIDTTAGVALRGTSNLYKVNEGGDSGLLRNGVLGNLFGFDIRESAQIQTPTKGTGANYTTTNAGYAVGTTTLHMITGTGTILAGDIVTFAGDTNKYVVATGFAGDGTGDIVLAAPGLRVAMSAATKAMTIFGTSAKNCAFTPNAIILGTRLPALPPQGDMAIDRYTITDPRSGISFELALYPGWHMNVYHLAVAWGVAVEKSEHLAIIVG